MTKLITTLCTSSVVEHDSQLFSALFHTGQHFPQLRIERNLLFRELASDRLKIMPLASRRANMALPSERQSSAVIIVGFLSLQLDSIDHLLHFTSHETHLFEEKLNESAFLAEQMLVGVSIER